MSNWDDEDFEPPAASAASAAAPGGASKTFTDAWEGEDEDVKDNWDASDSDENKTGDKPDEGSRMAGLARKKKTLLDKIREKEEKQLELAARKAEAERVYSEAEKRQKQEESDLALAEDALGVSNLSKSTDQGLLEKFDPKSLEDFAEFRFQLANKLLMYKDSPHYFLFIEDLFRELASGLSSEDTRKLHTMLQAMSNEKMKREKEKKKGPKGKTSTKSQLKQVGNAISEYNGYGDEENFADEYDDFI